LVDTLTGNSDQTPFGGGASTEPGFGPNTRTVMQFQLVNRTGAADPAAMNLLETLAAMARLRLGISSTVFCPNLRNSRLARAVDVRDLT